MSSLFFQQTFGYLPNDSGTMLVMWLTTAILTYMGTFSLSMVYMAEKNENLNLLQGIFFLCGMTYIQEKNLQLAFLFFSILGLAFSIPLAKEMTSFYIKVALVIIPLLIMFLNMALINAIKSFCDY